MATNTTLTFSDGDFNESVLESRTPVDPSGTGAGLVQ